MSIVKEYFDEKTKIKIHNDYITNEEKEIKEIIIALVINSIKNDKI